MLICEIRLSIHVLVLECSSAQIPSLRTAELGVHGPIEGAKNASFSSQTGGKASIFSGEVLCSAGRFVRGEAGKGR